MIKPERVRKGIFTKEQEDFLENVIKFSNPILEAIDGPLIKFIDNKGIELALDIADKLDPDVRYLIYGVIDSIFDPFIDYLKERI